MKAFEQRTTAAMLIMVVLMAITGPSAIAQTSVSKQEQKTVKVREKIKSLGIGERVKIKVETYGRTTFQGYVSAANDDDFVIVDKSGNSQTVKYSDVNKVGGKNLSTGAKIGIGIGIGVGATILFLAILFASLND